MSKKCGTCEKSVYPNDQQINLDGFIFHKTCAKCEDCKCQISLSNFTKNNIEGKTVLLCKTHYFKRFHEEGSYVGGDKYEKKAPRDGGVSVDTTFTGGIQAFSSSPVVPSVLKVTESVQKVSLVESASAEQVQVQVEETPSEDIATPEETVTVEETVETTDIVETTNDIEETVEETTQPPVQVFVPTPGPKSLSQIKFDKFDRNTNGGLDITEFRNMCREYGVR